MEGHKLTKEELAEALKKQLDLIYELLGGKPDPEVMKKEYTTAAQLISQQYHHKLMHLAVTSTTSGKDPRFEEQQIKKQYKDDLIALAVAIDDTLDSQPTTA